MKNNINFNQKNIYLKKIENKCKNYNKNDLNLIKKIFDFQFEKFKLQFLIKNEWEINIDSYFNNIEINLFDNKLKSVLDITLFDEIKNDNNLQILEKNMNVEESIEIKKLSPKYKENIIVRPLIKLKSKSNFQEKNLKSNDFSENKNNFTCYLKLNNKPSHIFSPYTSEKIPPEKCGYEKIDINKSNENLIFKNKNYNETIPIKNIKKILESNFTKKEMKKTSNINYFPISWIYLKGIKSKSRLDILGITKQQIKFFKNLIKK